MNIPDEVGEQALKADDTWVFIAEWARKEALAAVLRACDDNRVITKEVHRGYTVENFSDPLVRIAVIRALAEGDN